MREQRRLLEQAEHWRHRLITDGTRLEPGTRLLEVGCGAGRYSPCWDRSTRASSSSVSTSSRSSSTSPGDTSSARKSRAPWTGRRARAPVRGRVVRPRVDDVVPRARGRSARGAARGAARPRSGGGITAIEVDYSTVSAEPSTPPSRPSSAPWCRAWRRPAGATRARGSPWLRTAGFGEIDEGGRTFWWQGEDLRVAGRLRSRRDRERAGRARPPVRAEPRAARRPARPSRAAGYRARARLDAAQVDGAALAPSRAPGSAPPISTPVRPVNPATGRCPQRLGRAILGEIALSQAGRSHPEVAHGHASRTRPRSIRARSRGLRCGSIGDLDGELRDRSEGDGEGLLLRPLSQDGSSRPHRVLDQERGKTSHDFGIAGHTSKTVQPGKSTTIAVTLKPGRYPYKCTVDSH